MTWEEAVVWLRGQKDQQNLVKACFYDDPLIEAVERYWKSAEWVAIKEYLPKRRGNVLDLGAGRGISSFAFAKEGWNVTALEPGASKIVGSKAIKQLSKEANLDIKVFNKYGERIPFKDNTFDVVFGREVLHHAKNLKKFCDEANRVLKKGGVLIFVREHVISKKEDLPVFLDNHPLHKLYGGENALLLGDYLEAIENSGIQIKYVLNPLESDINLFPRTNKFVPKIVVKIIGDRLKYPGRLYSFIGKKI